MNYLFVAPVIFFVIMTADAAALLVNVEKLKTSAHPRATFLLALALGLVFSFLTAINISALFGDYTMVAAVCNVISALLVALVYIGKTWRALDGDK
jgi:uncharacterized membrane protein